MKKQKKLIPKFDSIKDAIKYHLKIWVKRFYYIAIIVMIIALLGATGLLSEGNLNNTVMIASVILYILALPISIFFSLDNLFRKINIENLYYPLILALFFVLLNFAFLASFLASWRMMKQRLTEIKEENSRKGL